MEATKVTIHRALSELKLIDNKIKKQIGELVPLGIHQKDRLVNTTNTKEDFESSAKSKYDSVVALIDNKQRIKSAIVQSNSKTQVTVAGKVMSVADAINHKAAIVYKKALLERLKAQRNEGTAALNRNNSVVDQNVQRILEAALGKDNVKPGKDDVEAIRKPYMEANEWHLFDPLAINGKIEAMDAEIGAFEAEVDAVLSESNAITFIEY